MNIQTIIGVVIAVAVVGGAGYYLSTTPSAAPRALAPAEEQSFASLFAMGGSHECAITVDVAEAPATGTVYVSGDQVRADFTTTPVTMGGASVSAHMIRSGGYVYSWTDMIAQGVKVEDSQGLGALEQSFGMDSRVDYDCKPWVADASRFEVPQNVRFMEMTADGRFVQ